jgi:hypothetical protein
MAEAAAAASAARAARLQACTLGAQPEPSPSRCPVPEPEPEPEPERQPQQPQQRELAAFRRLFRDGHAAAAAFEGSLGGTGLRGAAWKVFLGVLPVSPDRWSDAIATQRASYAALKRKWLPDPDAAEGMDPTLNNPLCPVDDSPWAKVGTCTPRCRCRCPCCCRCCAAAAHPSLSLLLLLCCCCLPVRSIKSVPSVPWWSWMSIEFIPRRNSSRRHQYVQCWLMY